MRLTLPLCIIAALLFLPLSFASPQAGIGLPRVFSGDEPHYLLLVNSLVRDGDLDLANNYREARDGDEQAGTLFAAKQLDHHTAWMHDGKLLYWADSDRLPAGTAPPAHEYSFHWPGMPILLAALLFPLAHSSLLEPAAIACSFLTMLLALLSFVSIARSLSASERSIVITTALTFLGTPLWHYGRTLFSEPYALCCVLAAHALYLRGKSVLWVGMLCAACVLFKNTYVLFAAPLGLHLLIERRWRDAVLFSLPLTAALAACLWLNHYMFGSYLQGPQYWRQGNVLFGTARLLSSPRHGLLPYLPIAVSALLGWPAFIRAHKTTAWLAAGTFGCMFCLTAMFENAGGYCYGPRYMVPVLPFLMLGLLFRTREPAASRWANADIVVLGALSVLINALGALPYWRFFSLHPLAGLFS